MTTTETPDLAEVQAKLQEIEAQVFGSDEPSASDCSGSCSDGEKPEGCPDYKPDEAMLNPVGRLIVDSLYHALEVCFGELEAEPRNILLIGGCRQRDIARRLGFLLPFARIYALDPDEGQIHRAEVDIKCRFKFTHGAVESLPLDDKSVDLTLAHNLFEYVDHWPQAAKEIQRVTKSHALIGFHRPVAGKLLSSIPGMEAALRYLGCQTPANQPAKKEIIKALNGISRVDVTTRPLPWQLMMCKIRG